MSNNNLSEAEKLYRAWHYRITVEFPGIYSTHLKKKEYLAAFLIVCNLLEFYMRQYLFEFSFENENQLHDNFVDLLTRLVHRLPQKAALLTIKALWTIWFNLHKWVLRKSELVERTPGYYIAHKFTLGALIREANKKGVDGRLVGALKSFVERRNMIYHNMAELDFASKDIYEECKKACVAANRVWDLLRELYLDRKLVGVSLTRRAV